MSEEQFERSQVGHDANDLHNLGGQDAPEENKTERESLEDAIEALEREADVEEVHEEPAESKKIEISDAPAEESVPAEEPKAEEPAPAEPVNEWKTKEENQPYMTIDKVEEPKATPDKVKKGGIGWKIATFFFLILAIAGCGAAAYLVFSDGKTNIFNRTINSMSSDKANQPTTPTPVVTPDEPTPEEGATLKGFLALFTKSDTIQILDVYYSSDKQYTFIYANINGVPEHWYRANSGTTTWQKLIGGQDASACAEVTEEGKAIIKAYNIITGFDCGF